MGLIITDSQNYTDIADAIRSKNGTSTHYYPEQMASAIMSISGGGGITPTGTYNIASNGVYDVYSYASASVSVPLPTGTITLSSNDTFNVYDYASAIVSVPEDPYMLKYQGANLLTTFTDTASTSIVYGAFAYTSSLATVSFPEAVTIGPYAFAYCYELRTISFPKVTTIDTYAFQYCSSMNYAINSTNFPSLTGKIGNGAFRGCQYLTGIDLPNVTSIGTQCFSACSRITTVNMPKLASTSTGAFSYLTTCSSYSLPVLTFVASNCFTSNWKLTTLTLPKAATISAYAFRYCSSLMSLYLTGSTVPTLNASAFLNMPFSVSVNNVYGSIYVPSSLYNSYIAATNWVTYKNRIVSM